MNLETLKYITSEYVSDVPVKLKSELRKYLSAKIMRKNFL